MWFCGQPWESIDRHKEFGKDIKRGVVDEKLVHHIGVNEDPRLINRVSSIDGRAAKLQKSVKGIEWYEPEVITTYDEDGNPYIHCTYTYDSQGNILTELREDWKGGAWVNKDCYTYSYDSQVNILTRLYEIWENGGWRNQSCYTHTYDSQGNILIEKGEYWFDDVWMIYERSTYTYNSRGNLLTKLR